MDSSRGTDTFLTAISFWPLHNVDFVLVCWHLKTLILRFNWYSSAASTQYLAVLFDVGVIYYPLPGMEKLVHCDKMWEFTRRQEPLTAHHNGSAANVGHFPILILPGAFQQTQSHCGTGLDPHSQPGTGGTSPYKHYRPLCVQPRWEKTQLPQFNWNLIKASFDSKQDKYDRSTSLPSFLCFSSSSLHFSWVDWQFWGHHHGGRAPAPHSWQSAGHRKQFIPLLMIYVISLDSLLA